MTAKTVAVTLTGPRLDGYEFPGPAAAAAAVCALTGTQAPVTLRARPGRRPLGSQAGQRVWVSWSVPHSPGGCSGRVDPTRWGRL